MNSKILIFAILSCLTFHICVLSAPPYDADLTFYCLVCFGLIINITISCYVIYDDTFFTDFFKEYKYPGITLTCLFCIMGIISIIMLSGIQNNGDKKTISELYKKNGIKMIYACIIALLFLLTCLVTFITLIVCFVISLYNNSKKDEEFYKVKEMNKTFETVEF